MQPNEYLFIFIFLYSFLNGNIKYKVKFANKNPLKQVKKNISLVVCLHYHNYT